MDEPNTSAQKRAHRQGQAAYLAGESVLDNPHHTNVAFLWWRKGWKLAEAANTTGHPRCPFCRRLLPQLEETS